MWSQRRSITQLRAAGVVAAALCLVTIGVVCEAAQVQKRLIKKGPFQGKVEYVSSVLNDYTSSAQHQAQ